MGVLLQQNEYSTIGDLNIFITDCRARLTDPRLINYTIFRKTSAGPVQVTLDKRPPARYDIGQYYATWRVPTNAEDSDQYYIVWEIQLCYNSPIVIATQWFSVKFLGECNINPVSSNILYDLTPDEQFALILKQLGVTAEQFIAMGENGDSTTLVSLTGYNIKFGINSPWWFATANPESTNSLRSSIGGDGYPGKE